MCKALREDRKNFDRNNTDEAKVLAARVFSAYKGAFVLKLPIGRNAASFGILFLGSKVRDPATVRHEYGHRLQWEQMGFFRFVRRVALPSVTANLMDRRGKLPYDYYGSPWEAEADRLGGASHPGRDRVWPVEIRKYRDLLRLRKKKNAPDLPEEK